jgi:hypothetical protein
MFPDEVISKFVRFKLMVKDSKHIRNMDHGVTLIPELPPVAFKTKKEKNDETTPSKGLQIDTSKIDHEEMALIIKSFRQILKQRKGKEYKPHSKRVCNWCCKFSHYIAKCPYATDRDKDKKGRIRWRRRSTYTRRRVVRCMLGESGTPRRAPLTPPTDCFQDLALILLLLVTLLYVLSLILSLITYTT